MDNVWKPEREAKAKREEEEEDEEEEEEEAILNISRTGRVALM